MPPSNFDVLIASDHVPDDGTTASVAQEIEVNARLGLRTGLVQVGASFLAPVAWAPSLRRLVAAGLAEVVSPLRPATARLLLLRRPELFAAPGWTLAARGERTLMIVDRLPKGACDVPELVALLTAELGSAPLLVPTAPMVRQALSAAGAALAPTDWHDVIDLDEWACPRPRRRGGAPVIGRTVRDDADEWPDSTAELLAAYPETRSPRVRVLGAIHAAQERIGRRPSGWEVFPAGSMTAPELLAGLDVYLHLHAAARRDPCPRPVLEALASGVPVVTHRYLEPLFGDACVYSEPRDAFAIVDALARDVTRARNQKGLDLVLERHGLEAHRRRLESYLGRALPALAPRAARRRRVLFVVGEGGGDGQLDALLAIARELPDDHDPLFLTGEAEIGAVRAAGFWVDAIPTPSTTELRPPEWAEYLQRRVGAALRALRPAALVYDGPSVPKALAQTVAQSPQVHRIWSRRAPVDAPGREAAAFHLVLAAGDLTAGRILALTAPAPVAGEEAASSAPETVALQETQPARRSALVRYPYAVFVRPVRRTVKRLRRSWRSYLQARRRRAGKPPPKANRPGQKKAPGGGKYVPTRILLIARDSSTAGLQALIEWVSLHPRGAVILAGPDGVEPLRRHGLIVELLADERTDEGHDRLDFAAYAVEKTRVLRAVYNCGPVLFWQHVDPASQGRALQELIG